MSPTYLTGANTAVGQWTYDSTCTNPNGTSQQSDQQWLAQSIVDNAAQTGQGASPSFYYPHTAMSAWLCRGLQQSLPNCNGGGYNPEHCPNNSSPQGQIFYSQITQANAPYNVYAVDLCNGPEGVGDAMSNVPGYDPGAFNGTISGFNAITYDMAGTPPNSSPTVTAQCVHPQ